MKQWKVVCLRFFQYYRVLGRIKIKIDDECLLDCQEIGCKTLEIESAISGIPFLSLTVFLQGVVRN